MHHRIAIVSIALTALLPVFAHAQITSTVSASSDTGGNVVAPGGTVKTGNSSASVEVQTVSGSGGGTSTVHIKTQVNGQKYEETYTKPSGSIGVSVAATSSGYEARVWEPGTSTPLGGSVRQGVYASTSVSATSTVQARLIERISTWFAKFLSFFTWPGW